MNEQEVFKILQHHLPPTSVAYCFLLWKKTPFELKLSKKRETKVGDFTCRRDSATQRITLNHDLNPYLFLVTYIHEVAHLRVFLEHRYNKEPHGKEWKQNFQQLIDPVLNENIFPPELLAILQRHMKNPKASSFADRHLTIALRKFDNGHAEHIMVSQLPEGSVFKLQGKYFKKGSLRRTRFLCRELKSKRQFLVPSEAVVSEVQLSLL
jgi:SprT protein